METTQPSKLAMTFTEALSEMNEGRSVRRMGWNDCKLIRASRISDNDHFMHEVNLNGAIMEDCKEKSCDCSISIWPQPVEDKEQNDWVIV